MNNEQKRQAVEMLLSWVRVFSAAMIAQYLAGYTDPEMLLNAGIAAVLPVVLRWIDPQEKTYGRGAAGLPNNLILDAGTISSGFSSGVREITISQTLSAGKYWLAAVGQVGSCTLRADNAIQHSYYRNAFSTDDQDCFEQSGVSGALPSTFTGTSMRNSSPRIMLRVA